MSDLFVVVEDDSFLEPIERPEQFGPLRWFDTEMRCASRGCSSPTWCKVTGVPYCMMHALRKLNEMVIEYERMAG